jgi:hypothetical protein
LPVAFAVCVAVVETPASVTVTCTVPPIRTYSPVNDTVAGVPAYAGTGAGETKYIAKATSTNKKKTGRLTYVWIGSAFRLVRVPAALPGP